MYKRSYHMTFSKDCQWMYCANFLYEIFVVRLSSFYDTQNFKFGYKIVLLVIAYECTLVSAEVMF